MKLELYHRWACPYSAKVRDYISEHDLSMIVFHDIDSDSDAENRLVSMIGEVQVPCLVVNGNPMLESDKIIRWLGDNMTTTSQAA